MNYGDTAEQLTERILKLIPKQPQILDITDPWKLFKVPGFKCDDLGPSAAQAGFALEMAKRRYRLPTKAAS